MIYVFFLISYILNKLIIPSIEKLYLNAGFVRQNYKGDLIPNSMGIIFIFNILFSSLFILTFTNSIKYNEIFLFILGVFTMGFVGLFDDFIGNNDVKGFRGHINMLINFKLTTGGIKAVFGGITSVSISLVISNSLFDFLINILIISLFTNFINLMDLRPGRALKVFFIFSIPSLFLVSGINKIILLSFIGAALAYFPHDLKGRSMLGDIGSNCIGIVIGIVATSFSFHIKATLSIFLIFANLYSEKHSFTKLIGRNKVLNFLDELGRN